MDDFQKHTRLGEQDHGIALEGNQASSRFLSKNEDGEVKRIKVARMGAPHSRVGDWRHDPRVKSTTAAMTANQADTWPYGQRRCVACNLGQKAKGLREVIGCVVRGAKSGSMRNVRDATCDGYFVKITAWGSQP